MKILFSVISVALIFIGLFLYGKETKNKKSKPNIIVLFLWVITALINLITYIIIVQDLFKSALLIATVVANIIITLITIKSQNYLFLKRDIWIVITAILSTCLLTTLLNVKDMHLIIQIITTIPFIPLLIGITKKQGKEPIFPWIIIFISTIFSLLTIIVEYSDYWSLISPIRSAAFQFMVIICIKLNPQWNTAGIFFLLKTKIRLLYLQYDNKFNIFIYQRFAFSTPTRESFSCWKN